MNKEIQYVQEKDGVLDVRSAKYIAAMIENTLNSYQLPKERIEEKIIKLFEKNLLVSNGKSFLFLMLGYLKQSSALTLKEIFLKHAKLAPYVPDLFNNLLFHQIRLRNLTALKYKFVSLFQNKKDDDDDEDEYYGYEKHKDEKEEEDDDNNNNNNCQDPTFSINHLAQSQNPDEICPLIKVFKEEDESRSDLFKDEPLDDAEYSQVYYPAKFRTTNRIVTPSYPIFKDTFDIFTNGILGNVNWDDGSGCKVVVAGGAVIASLFPVPQANLNAWKELQWARRAISPLPLPARDLIHYYLGMDKRSYHWLTYDRFFNGKWANGDIDLFLVAKSESSAKTRVLSLINEITSKIPTQYRIIKTDRSVTILPLFPYRPVQIITTILSCVQDYLVYCDLDIATFIYDPPTRNLVAMDRSIWAFNSCYNLIGPTDWKITSSRCEKYFGRGIGTVIFEICKHKPRCDQIDSMPFHYEPSTLPYGSHINTLELLDYCLESLDPPPIILSSSNPPPKYNHPNAIGYRSDLLDSLIEITWKYTYEENRFAKLKCYQCEKEIQTNIDVDDERGRQGDDEDHERGEESKEEKKEKPIPGPQLCLKCKNTNQKKWDQWNSIHLDNSSESGKRYALITGGRIKIGYESAVRLLKSGFHVMVTTRFPYNASNNFASEADYDQWKDRLYIYGIDLRQLPAVNQLTEYVKKTFPRLDILINNAAQTIRRPRAYYHNLLNLEQKLASLPIGSSLKKLIVHGIIDNDNNNNNQDATNTKLLSLIQLTPSNNNNNKSSVEMTQLILHEQDVDERNDELFPMDLTDEHGEQLDLRTKTSWNMQIEEISPVEMLEVQVVNASVPFMLVSNLSCLMGANHKKQNPNTNPVSFDNCMGWGFIVNVTSPEGAFNGKDSGFHVHTNMAKSALNMMTKSIATQYVKDSIFVYASDPGWVTKMQPFGSTIPSITEAPLNCKDGAARILDPIYEKFKGLENLIQEDIQKDQGEESSRTANATRVKYQLFNSFMAKNHGCLFKHYKVHPW